MTPDQLFLVILISSVLGFGGFGALPVLHAYLDQAGLAADALILQGLTIGRLSPGPNGLYMVAIGYFVAGIWGAVAASVAVLIPPLLILPIARLRHRLEHLPRFRAVFRALGLAVVALLASTTVSIVEQAATSVLASAIIAAAALLVSLRVSPLVILVIASAVGYVALQ